MGTSQYIRLPRLCDIRAGCRLPGQVHCAHFGCVDGSRARGRAAHCRRRWPRCQDEQWVRANIATATAVRYPSRQPIRRQVHCAHRGRSHGAHRHHSRSHLRRRRCRCVEQRRVRQAPTRLHGCGRASARAHFTRAGRLQRPSPKSKESRRSTLRQCVRCGGCSIHWSALGLCRPGPLPAGGGWGTLVVGLTSGLRSRCGHCSAPFGIGTF